MPKGFGATVNVAKPKKGSSVAIFGLGAVGLAVSHSYFFSIPVLKLIRTIVLIFPCYNLGCGRCKGFRGFKDHWS